MDVNAGVPAELGGLARQHLDAFIRSAREECRPEPATLRFARDLGAQRAREMVPLAVVVENHLLAWARLIRALASVACGGETASAAIELAAVQLDHAAAATGQLIEGYVEALEGERLARDADRRALLDELLSRADLDDSSFARRAGTFGLEPGRTEVVVCMKVLRAEGEDDGPSATHWAATAIALASGRGASRAFVVARLDDVVAVLDAVGPHNARTVLGEVASAAERRKVTIQAAIGSTFTDLGGVLDSYNSAMRALRHTGRARPIVWSPSDITLFDELVLSYAGDGQRLIPTKTRRALSDPTVRSTLEALFKANLNVAVAAEALFLHPNSLRYRLAAITRSTGRDPRKPGDLFELCAAARVLDADSVSEGRR